MNILLSLCMIVKDEEAVLRRCLESVQGFVDEIIIVDTGSTDGTKEIAAEFTDEIYDFTWVDDFSAARNEALRHANGRWILVLDADEYLSKEQHAEVRARLQTENPADNRGFVLQIYNFTRSTDWTVSSALRLFPNNPAIYYERSIHEQVVCKNGTLQFIDHFPLSIFHTGYTAERIQEKNKSSRNLELLEQLRKQRPFTEYDYFTLANEYSNLEDYEQAIHYYRLAATEHARNRSFFPACLRKLAVLLTHLDRIGEARAVIDSGIMHWPAAVDFHCLKAELYMKAGHLEQAAALYRTCIALAEQHSRSNQDYWLVQPQYGNVIPFSALSHICEYNMDWQHEAHYLHVLLHFDKTDSPALGRLLHLLLLTGSTDQAIASMDKLYGPPAHPSFQLLPLQASLRLGNRQLADMYYSRCQQAALPGKLYHRLYYALVQDDCKAFVNGLQSDFGHANTAAINKLISVAALVWQDARFIPLLLAGETADEREACSAQDAVLHYLFGHPHPEAAPVDLTVVVDLLSELFQLGHYGIYDQVLTRFPAEADQLVLANGLGDYFFAQDRIELAFDYYAKALGANRLAGSGYENLARYYLAQGELAEGLDFLTHAISANPDNRRLYPLYFKYIQYPAAASAMLIQYQRQLPECSRLLQH